jgi:soluble cytochrome b562
MFFTGVGFTAVALLLKLPAVPNCPATFWPTASASMRLYCAQLAANKQTGENLLEAIALVEGLPKDHPLRPEINRHVEEWSLDILKIGDKKFQEGQLSEAIKIARRIPENVSAYKLVENRIDRWQTIWSKAEAIYEQAENQLRESNWLQAFREAVKLTSINNKYWATAKYDQLTNQIQIARKASEQLDKAYQLSKSGRIADILAAIKQAEEIPSNSYAYKEAQELIADCGNKLLKLAMNRLEQRNWKGVLEIANKIPASVKLGEVKTDLIDLANALSRGESGTVSELETAIATAQRLGSDRPLYDKAQEFIKRWQKEVEDIGRLERARAFANSGFIDDLKAAIAEAQQIPSGNPRYDEARREIRSWTSKVETIEDQPYLDRANQIASFGGVASLQEAVQEASRIAPGRALHKQAQEKITQWTRNLQRVQDQPYLDQARSLAASGNLPEAISAAQQITTGRALYKEAQSEIRIWQTEIRGQQRLQEAYQTANPGTPEALAAAIRAAREVPTASRARGDARAGGNRWSYQLFSMAQDRSAFNVTEAIAIARMIPSGTEVYEAAKEQIQSWQQSLEPSPAPLEVPTGTDAQ